MDADTLAILEEKVLRTIETVGRLRKEKDAAANAGAEAEQLRSQVRALEERNAALLEELQAARVERDSLRSDKDTVRQRLERLLSQIDALGA